MSDEPLFQGMDAQEREYAPEQVPSEQKRVIADEGADRVQQTTPSEPPPPSVVANIGTAPSAAAAPPEGDFRERDDDNQKPGVDRSEPRTTRK